MNNLSYPLSYQLFAARVFALIALWSVPISTALTNTSIILFGITALLAPEVWCHCRSAIRHPVSVAAVLLALALVLSALYSVAPITDNLDWFAKYRKLLFIPLLILVFQDADLDDTARWGLFVSLVFVLLLSTSNYFGLTAAGPLYDATRAYTHAWVFKNHITAGLFSALLFNMSVNMAMTMTTATTATHKYAKVAFYGIAMLAFANVFVMLAGRTGQIIAACLLIYQVIGFFIRTYRGKVPTLINKNKNKNTAWHAFILFAFVLSCLLLIGISFQIKTNRLTQVSTEISDYRQHNKATSVGLRLEWYRKCLALFVKRPILGYGLAAVHQEFKILSQHHTGAAGTVTANPHSQYLLLAVELGLIGIGLFINLLIQIARTAMQLRLLRPLSCQLLGAYLFIFTVGCFANSLLLDFSEGYLLVLISGIFCASANVNHPNSKPKPKPIPIPIPITL